MLQYILTEFSKEAGISINTDIERASAIAKINKAASELYSMTDLVGCLREQVFNVDQSGLQITLPYYVDQIRNVRNYDTASRVKIDDMRPRYFYGRNWPQQYLTWRKKNKLSIGRDLENDGPLTISIAAAETSRFKVYITGSTIDADRITEEIIFEIGDTEHTTTNSFTTFPGFQLIAKDSIIAQNVTVEDADGNVVSEIANCELEASYTLVAVSDFQTVLPTDCYEFLYKYKLSPFYNDYDVFPAPNYDDAIVYKACSHVWSKDTSPVGQAKVLEYEAKCEAVMKNRAMDGEGSDEKELQIAPNRFFDIQGGGYPTSFAQDTPIRAF